LALPKIEFLPSGHNLIITPNEVPLLLLLLFLLLLFLLLLLLLLLLLHLQQLLQHNQFFIIYVPSQQLQGQLQTQHSVDTRNYIMDRQHKVNDKLQLSTGEKNI
jgi:hypothetical protein